MRAKFLLVINFRKLLENKGKSNKIQQNPTKDNENQQKTTKTNEKQQKPTKNNEKQRKTTKGGVWESGNKKSPEDSSSWGLQINSLLL